MNRSYSKIRHIQNSNMLLESRYINEEATPGGAFINVEIQEGNINYYPNVKNIENVKKLIERGDKGTHIYIDTQYNPQKKEPTYRKGQFKQGMGALKFNKDYGIGGQAINLNTKLDLLNPIEIKAGNIIIGDFDTYGLSGNDATLYAKTDSDPFAEYIPKDLDFNIDNTSRSLGLEDDNTDDYGN